MSKPMMQWRSNIKAVSADYYQQAADELGLTIEIKPRPATPIKQYDLERKGE